MVKCIIIVLTRTDTAIRRHKQSADRLQCSYLYWGSGPRHMQHVICSFPILISSLVGSKCMSRREFHFRWYLFRPFVSWMVHLSKHNGVTFVVIVTVQDRMTIILYTGF